MTSVGVKSNKGDEKLELPEVEPAREEWEKQIEFILTLIGYAVGLGNVWRFPFLCYKNGGGAFLIPYVTCLIFLGIPIFALELCFGQYGGKGAVLWYINRTMKGLGYAGAITSAVISIYYNVIIAWSFYYMLASMTAKVPWANCNSCECFAYQNSHGMSTTNIMHLNCSTWTGKPQSPSEIYFNEDVLQKSSGIQETGHIVWKLMLCNLAGWIIVTLVLHRGIKSLGKVVYVTTIAPYCLLLILLIRGLTLEGAMDGVKFYLTPDWSRLTDTTVWSDAAVQIFFSLSSCQGGLIAMSSYNKFHNNVLRDAIMIPIINGLTSFFAGFVVFSTLGFMAHIQKVNVADVVSGGAGLAFVAYPEALSNMPATTFWSILFFATVCVLGLSSQFSMVETIVTFALDNMPKSLRTKRARFTFRIGLSTLLFLLGLPIVTQAGAYFLDVMDTYIVGFNTLAIGIYEIVAICYIYGYPKFAEDIESMIGHKPFIYFKICWMVITPAMLLLVIVTKAMIYIPMTATGSPVWAEVMGWTFTILPQIPIFAMFFSETRHLWSMCLHPSQLLEGLKNVCKPRAGWRKKHRRGSQSSWGTSSANLATLDK